MPIMPILKIKINGLWCTIPALVGPIGPQGQAGSNTSDFTHTANALISASSLQVTFAANARCSQMITVSDDIDLDIVCQNDSDNYLWIKNTANADIDVTISGITYKNTALAAANIHIPGGSMTVGAGDIIEIAVVCNADGAFITSRNDLK